MRGPVAALVLLSSVALAQQVQPKYSEEASIAGLEGRVVVSAVISSDETLNDFSIVQPLGLGLDEQAIEALRQVRLPNRYPPGREDDIPGRLRASLQGIALAFGTDHIQNSTGRIAADLR
jgi:protein TonB